MASASIGTARSPEAGQLLLACVEQNGSASHPWARSPELLRGEHASRGLADLIHFLCTLHGRYPGVIDHASGRMQAPAPRAWLAQASYAFAGERAYLARLAVAAGPVPATPCAAGSDSAVLGQRNAIELLAQSERAGCGLGTALALVMDWAAIRVALDAAAHRFGVEPPSYPAADSAAVAGLADLCATTPPFQRALLFGAQQILLQHRGLWDLLEARHQARLAG